jgi:hypothetical protein
MVAKQKRKGGPPSPLINVEAGEGEGATLKMGRISCALTVLAETVVRLRLRLPPPAS